MAEPTELPEIDLDVADVKRIALTTDPQGATLISFEMASGQVMNLVFSPETFAKRCVGKYLDLVAFDPLDQHLLMNASVYLS